MITLTREEAQQVLDAFEVATTHFAKDRQEILAAREILRTRLSAPEPEPLAWYVRFDSGRADLLASPITEARRAMWESAGKRFTVTPLYIAPPQREWQGLTDDEQMHVAWSCGAMSADWLDFARAIEAKLKEKNG